jgi:GWxTD domain-containing protein
MPFASTRIPLLRLLITSAALFLTDLCALSVEPAEPRPVFDFTLCAVPSYLDSGGGVDLFVAVTNDQLHFVRQRNRFLAEYSIAVDILDAEGLRIAGKSSRHRKTAKGFDQTTSQEERTTNHFHFDLPTGDYRAVARVRDEDLKRESNQKEPFEIVAVGTHEIALSDLLLLGERAEATGGDFDRFKSLYFKAKADERPSILVLFRLVGAEQPAECRALFRRPTGEVARDLRFQIPAESKWRFVELSTKDLPGTVYDLEIRAQCADTLQTTATRKLMIRAAGLSPLVENLDEAIAQLLYIADSKTLKMMKAADADAKKQLLQSFWKERDPSPGTPDNELMNEYYHRIHEADERFRCYKAGWKTDRGWVFVTYGEPNEVERYPFELDSRPYEVWRYYRPERRFLFIDKNGFGDYDLESSSGGNYDFGVD